jgi:23S rRNA (uracil1939-C5)-methyltransferase
MVRVRPERFVAGGEAIARDDDGRVLFVRGGMPGDDVTVTVTEQHGDWSRGTVDSIHVASPDRVSPPCPRRREGCGGCDWQHVAESVQLTAKVAIVVDALRRTGKLDEPRVRAAGSVPARGYRTTIRVVGDGDGRAAFRMERSTDTVPASGCLVAHPALVAMLDRLVVPAGVELTLRVSAATGEATAWWDPRAGAVDGLPPHVVTGPAAALTEGVAGHRFRVSAASFFQSGPAAAELLVDRVSAAAPELGNASRVLDAYAGVGLFAVAATPPEAYVVAVESSRSAAADCGANLRTRRARVERRQVGEWRPKQGEAFDVVIADPARTGLGKPGVRAVAAAGAPVLVLVSCDPVTLARDAALLRDHGYRHETTEVVDLFPGTHHVEAVTRFTLRDLPLAD